MIQVIVGPKINKNFTKMFSIAFVLVIFKILSCNAFRAFVFDPPIGENDLSNHKLNISTTMEASTLSEITICLRIKWSYMNSNRPIDSDRMKFDFGSYEQQVKMAVL